MKKIIIGLGLAMSVIVGCTTSQQTVAYKGSVATDATVTGSMVGWGIYVGAKHPGTNQEYQVLHAWQAVKAAELTVNDAENVLVTDPTNTSPLITAENVYEASKTNLFTTISSITNAINH